jgi:hypothetical protein
MVNRRLPTLMTSHVKLICSTCSKVTQTDNQQQTKAALCTGLACWKPILTSIDHQKSGGSPQQNNHKVSFASLFPHPESLSTKIYPRIAAAEGNFLLALCTFIAADSTSVRLRPSSIALTARAH